MEYSKIQYISQGETLEEQEQNIKNALENGADWIQVRWKNASASSLLTLSEIAVQWCRKYQAVCIINDSIAIAKQTGADGVHLGLEDESIAKARAMLGADKIIGGTANTLDDVRQRILEGCNYIGLGPFRFTATKEKLSPILGLEGYRKIFQALALENSSHPPIYAIGGIKPSDFQALTQVGLYGIALSKAVTNQPEILRNIKYQLK